MLGKSSMKQFQECKSDKVPDYMLVREMFGSLRDLDVRISELSLACKNISCSKKDQEKIRERINLLCGTRFAIVKSLIDVKYKLTCLIDLNEEEMIKEFCENKGK